VRPFLARFALSLPPVRRTLRRRVAGLSIAYPPPRGSKEHPWTGQRVPDVSIGASHLYAEMRHGHFTLLDRTGNGQLADAVAEAWSDHVTTVPVPPTIAPNWPAVTLIRPDGYIAWASDHATSADQLAAISHWCGPTSTAGTPRHANATDES
jgi:hypothetical protein